MPVISWSKSECRDGWLHRYKMFAQDSNAVMEICELCRDVQVFRIVNGKTDNQTYLKYHLRSALPPWHTLYQREYKHKKS